MPHDPAKNVLWVRESVEQIAASQSRTLESTTELLAGAKELGAIDPGRRRIAVCDYAAEALLRAAWPAVELVRRPAPTAADAVRLAEPRILAGKFLDLALLDGNYLRRSDAEIFGGEIPGAAEGPHRA